MSANPANIRFYGSANMPDVDGATVGGAVDFTKKIDFTDIASAGLYDYVSSSASDTAATIALTGRDSTGVSVTETKTLTGTTVVAGTQSFERIQKAVAGGTTAVGDIAALSHTAIVSAHTCQVGSAQATGTLPTLMKLQAGDGAARALGELIRTTGGTGPNQIREIVGLPAQYGTDIVAVNRDWGTLPDATTTYNVHSGMLFDLLPSQITQVRRPFYNVSSDVLGGATRVFYEKVFPVNVNTLTAITSAVITKQVDPSAGTLQIAVCKALNDTATAANRQTLPANGDASALTFTAGSAPQSQNVPSPGNLPSGATPNAAGAQGVWLSLSLTAGLAPSKTSLGLRGAGNTV